MAMTAIEIENEMENTMENTNRSNTDADEVKPKKAFQRYQGLTRDTPAFPILFGYFLPFLQRLQPILRPLLAIRWQLSQPLQVRVLPKWLCGCSNSSGGDSINHFLTSIQDVTYGQVLLAVPIFLLLLAGYFFSFSNRDLDWSGTIAALALIGSFLTANKSNSALSFFLGIPVERMIPYHNMTSLAAIVLSIFHTYVAYVYGRGSDSEDEESDTNDEDGQRELSSSSSEDDSDFAQFGTNPDLIKFLLDGTTNISGTLIILCMMGLVATSFFSILRRWFFEFWLFTHIFAVVGVIVFSILHNSNTIYLVASWWIVDLVFRHLIMPLYMYPKNASLELILPDVVEVRFPKPDTFAYNAGQYVNISFPSVGAMQFHPITISSAPHEPDVTLHIRSLGNWSKALAKLAEKHSQASILIEGPYGNLSMDLDNDDRYQMALMISGGIGVTPCQSIAKSLLYQHSREGRKLDNIHFAWAVLSLEMAQRMPPPVVVASEECVNTVVLSTNIYVTRGGESPPSQDEEDPNNNGSNAAPNQTIHSGRPNFDVMFVALKKEATQKSLNHVAVIACGPRAMLDQVKAACRDHSDSDCKCGSDSSGVKFDLHEEIFDF